MTPEDPDDLPEALARVVLLAQQTEIAARRFFRVGARHAARAYRFGRRLAREREQRRRADLRRKWRAWQRIPTTRRRDAAKLDPRKTEWLRREERAREERAYAEWSECFAESRAKPIKEEAQHLLRGLRAVRERIARVHSTDLARMRVRVAAWRAEQEAKL
jgi:hypothetical protein